MTQPPAGKVSLIRGLGLIAAVSVVVGNIIGTGVFLKARVMICNVGKPSVVIIVWIVAGVLSLAGALTYAELAAMMPHAGGEYVYIKRAYGSLLSFLYGWMQIFISKTGSQAAVAVAFATFLNDLVRARTGSALKHVLVARQIFGTEFSIDTLQIIALGLIAIVTIVNCASVSVSGLVATAMTVIKICLVLGVGCAAFALARGSFSHFALANIGGTCSNVSASTQYGLAGFGAAMLGALWGYDGWNNLPLVAGEVKNPQRNIPLALVGGMLLIIGLYVFVNIAYFYVLTPTQIASVSRDSSVASEVIATFLGPIAVGIMAAGLMASSVGTLHTSILTGARVPYAMARDGLFFPLLSRLSTRTHVPTRALIVQAVWAGALALSGSFDTLTDYVIFGSWIFYGITTASLFVFRRRFPDEIRPYKAWGYPIVPGLFLLATAGLLINTLVSASRQAIIGLCLIALGLPVYYYIVRNGLPPQSAEGVE